MKATPTIQFQTRGTKSCTLSTNHWQRRLVWVSSHISSHWELTNLFQEPGVTFVGRLASYKYFNMDQAILNALELFDNLVEEKKIKKKS